MVKWCRALGSGQQEVRVESRLSVEFLTKHRCNGLVAFSFVLLLLATTVLVLVVNQAYMGNQECLKFFQTRFANISLKLEEC